MKPGKKPLGLLNRFEQKYIPEPNSGCWLWTGSDNGYRGYGLLGIRNRQKGEHYNLLAHRVSWMVHRGDIPNGALILHKCDVRSCVNPDHLFLGSARDNTQDMIAKGRRSPECGNRNRDESGRYVCAR
jgi:hypothetical protein